MNIFEDSKYLHEHTRIALNRADIFEPFEIQSEVIPAAAEGCDMLIKAPTGSGKTFAYGLPIIRQIPRGTKVLSAVIVVPTRELARQVTDDLVPIAWATQLRVVAVFGGSGMAKQIKLANNAAIIVATPGRLIDLVKERKIDLKTAEILVLDEADRMLDLGFQGDIDELVNRMPARRQTLCLSATFNAKVQKIAAQYMGAPHIVESSSVPVEGAHDVSHELLETTLRAKVDTLISALDDSQRDLSIVFVRTKQGADNLTSTLREYGIRSTKIHGGMAQHERLRELRLMQQGHCDVLVTTDIFARGMDISRVTHVINYELPEDADSYLHRAGRTGRAGRSGVVLTLVAQRDYARVEALLEELRLPRELMRSMRPDPKIRHEKVSLEEQYSGSAIDAPRKAPKKPLVIKEKTSAKKSNRVRPSKSSARPGEGVINGYDDSRGFGFIRQLAGGQDIFFHRSSMKKQEIPRLRKGLRVSYEIDAEHAGKLRAKQVRVATARRSK